MAHSEQVFFSPACFYCRMAMYMLMSLIMSTYKGANMKPIGIIAEFNPFHNGHEYIIKQAKLNFPGAPVIICMSGNFVQRGEPAITDKWTRAQMALACGADLVIELPTIFASASADLFCNGGVRLLAATGLCPNIICGAEAANMTVLKLLAGTIDNAAFKTTLNSLTDSGLGYAEAFAQACSLCAQTNSNSNLTVADFSKVMSHPNNLLAVHYLKNISEYAPELSLTALDRIKAKNLLSASEIRKTLRELKYGNGISKLDAYMPENSFALLQASFSSGKTLVDDTMLWHILRHIVISTPVENLSTVGDISEGLENRIIQAMRKSKSLTEALEAIKTKRYTRTRIQRCLMHILLGITRQDIKNAYKSGPGYLRILGFNECGAKLLHDIKKSCRVPMITRSGRKYLDKHFEQLQEPFVKRQFMLDMQAADIYTNLLSKTNIADCTDSKRQVINFRQ